MRSRMSPPYGLLAHPYCFRMSKKDVSRGIVPFEFQICKVLLRITKKVFGVFFCEGIKITYFLFVLFDEMICNPVFKQENMVINYK